MAKSDKSPAKRKVRVLTDAHVYTATTNYLQSLSIIDDNDTVTEYKKVPEGIEVTIETLKEKND